MRFGVVHTLICQLAFQAQAHSVSHSTGAFLNNDPAAAVEPGTGRGSEVELKGEAPKAEKSTNWFRHDFCNMTLIPLAVVTAVLAWQTRPRTKEDIPPGFRKFQWKYLSIWYLAIMADWFQGPYVYALYASYGYPSNKIAQLFVGGFASSMFCSMFIGSIADRWGRKRCVLLYCFFYIVSCITKHFNLYAVLMFGRITGGIATSLLFSSFECWMVAEHVERHKFNDELLRYMFSMMYFGMYAVAIFTGFIGDAFVAIGKLHPTSENGHVYFGGETAAFDLSLLLLLIIVVPIMLLWDENYGDMNQQTSFASSLVKAGRTVFLNPRIAVLGLVVSLFEGSMFAFVFNWTPTLPSSIHHGLVFSLFMMACVCGSSTFAMLNPDRKPITVLLPTFMLGCAAFIVVAICSYRKTGTPAIFYCFLVFEFCVGLYFPSMGTMKSQVVPEESRAGVYNIYRVPLNFIVCAVLLSDMSLGVSFMVCAILLGGGIALMSSFLVCGQASMSKQEKALA